MTEEGESASRAFAGERPNPLATRVDAHAHAAAAAGQSVVRPVRAREHVRELVLLFAVALVLRLAALVAHDCAHHVVGKDAWSWGYESACIARSLAEGHGFAGQWARAEPPWSESAPVTGWLTPAYPALIALCLKAGGGLTPFGAGLLLAIQCVLSALTCLCVWSIGAALGGLRLARLAGFALALLPYSIWNAAHTVWDTTCVSAALALFAAVLLGYGRGASVVRAAALGAAFGLLLLVNPAPGSILPVALVVVTIAAAGWRARFARALAFGLAALALVTPWCLRNQNAVGSFALRTNLGVELMVGNNDRANGYFQTALHPSYSAPEFRRYVALGEVAYAAECGERARTWTAAHPAAWVGLTARRALIFWFGDFPPLDPRREGALSPASDPASWIKWVMHALVGVLALAGCGVLARRSFDGRVLCAMVLLFPAPYYFTHVLERYRFPMEPLLVVAASAFVLAALDRWRARPTSGVS